MADGQVWGRHDRFSICTPCSLKGANVTAEKYCLKCEVLFCKQCLKHHDKVLNFHPMEDAGPGGASRKVLVGNLPTKMCEEHFKVVDMYCQQDDAIGCAVCMAISHRSCESKSVRFIPNSTAELLHQNDIDELNGQLAALIESLKSENISLQADLAGLDVGKIRCLDAVDDHRTQLQSLLDSIVSASKDGVINKYNSVSAELQSEHQKIARCLDDLEVATSGLRDCHGNDAQTFVQLKKCQQIVKETNQIYSAVKRQPRIKGLDVCFDVKCMNLLTELLTFVTVISPLTVKKKCHANISVKEDNQTSDVRGMCVLKDGSLLLADQDNKVLKRFDINSETITDKCSLKDKPTDVCCISDETVVVAQAWRLVFVSIKPRLTSIKNLKLDHGCSSVAYGNDRLYVTDGWETLFVHNLEGALITTVSADQAGNSVFRDIRQVAMADDGEKVWVTDRQKGLVILDREGRVLDTLEGSDIEGTEGVCSNGSGGVFVCGSISKKVIHVGRRNIILSVLRSESDDLVKPQSVCYDKRNKRLYISQCESNRIVVLELA